jgi:heme-degrading monooxygenase HmoA
MTTIAATQITTTRQTSDRSVGWEGPLGSGVGIGASEDSPETAVESVIMFVRLGSFEVVPGKLVELRDTYNRECVPIVRAAAGNIDAYLLEPAEGGGPIVACTVWKSEQDATVYEASGTAKQVVGKVKAFFAGPPTLRSYRVQR